MRLLREDAEKSLGAMYKDVMEGRLPFSICFAFRRLSECVVNPSYNNMMAAIDGNVVVDANQARCYGNEKRITYRLKVVGIYGNYGGEVVLTSVRSDPIKRRTDRECVYRWVSDSGYVTVTSDSVQTMVMSLCDQYFFSQL